MNKKEVIIETYPDETFMFVDGFDDAIIGLCERTNCVIYSVQKIVKILMVKEEMEYIDAVEHFDFNIAGGYVGELTPIFCYEIFE